NYRCCSGSMALPAFDVQRKLASADRARRFQNPGFFNRLLGRIDRYQRNADGTFNSPAGFYDVLRQNANGTFTIRDRVGFKRIFNSNGQLEKLIDRFGNTMSFSYNSNGQLDIVTDTLGRDVHYT